MSSSLLYGTVTAGDPIKSNWGNNFRLSHIRAGGDFAIDEGSADAIVINIAGDYTAYSHGDEIRFEVSNTNTSSSTLNVNGIGAKTLKKSYNSNLSAGDIVAGQMLTVRYDSVNDWFQIVGGVGSSPTDYDRISTEVYETNAFTGIRRGAIALCDNGLTMAMKDGNGAGLARVFQRKSIGVPFGRGESAVSGLSVTPDIMTRVQVSGTDYIVALSLAGTSAYRYTSTFGSETLLTISGTTLTGAQRIGWDGTYVYIQDGTDSASTTVKRFTLSGTTLTYYDTITLGTAPTDTGSLGYQIVFTATELLFFDVDTNSAQTINVYLISDGSLVETFTQANNDSNVTLVADWRDLSKHYTARVVGSASTDYFDLVPFDKDLT